MPNFWARPKVDVHFVPIPNILHKKMISILVNLVFVELNAIKFLDQLKNFGLQKKLLGPVEGQGISGWEIELFDRSQFY